MALIPIEIIQKVLAGVDIVDIISPHVKLKIKGANHLACCPFHQESTPSFTVSASKQFYHCFGCHEHGDAIRFLVNHLGMTFVDAVKELALVAGVDIPEPGVPEKTDLRLYDLMRDVSHYYSRSLLESSVAMPYLSDRGVTRASIDRFGLGFSLPGPTLDCAFEGDHAGLVESGMVIKDENSARRFDRFRDRVMFPIQDTRGRVIGFGGRVTGKSEPKYLNSPETSLFKKGGELYGFYQAKKSILTEKCVLVVEGYLDVVMLSQHGIENVVATLGTATTPFHVQKLLKASDKIIYCFDGDKAGLKAARKALENTLPAIKDGKEVVFMFLPSAHDPDSFVREFGKDAFLHAIKSAQPLADFFMAGVVADIEDSATGHVKMIGRAKPLLESINSKSAPATLMLLTAVLAKKVGVPPSSLDAVIKGKPVEKVSAGSVSAAAMNTRQILQCVLFDPSLGSIIPDSYKGEGPFAAMLGAALDLIRGSGFLVTRPGLAHMLLDTPHSSKLPAIEAEMLFWGDEFDAGAELAGIVKRVLRKPAVSFKALQQSLIIAASKKQ